MSSLTISNLSKRYGAVEVLDGIDLAAEAGEFIVLVGPSGCGKSTLLALIAGLETITSGEIRIGERVVNNVPPKDRDIAMVFQSYALYPTMTVRQNITFGMESRGVPKAEQNEAVARVASLLQIEPLLKRKPSQLSGGQRQRVAMGRALVRDPLLFLFDEPLSNLDAKLRVEMRTEIKKLYRTLGKTTVYVTHDQIEAMTLATRIAVMYQGRLQQFDRPKVIYEKPANMFVAGFMGSPSMNFLDVETFADNGRASLALGNELMLPVPDAADLTPGRKLVLGLRPEHLAHANGDDLPSLPARVEVVEPTGAETIVILKLGDHEVTARFDPDGAPAEGEIIDLAVAINKACLFDPETGLRL
ncbi:MAG: sn-glycerol-3-phosphate ABC transporter ATP-binding protein UgpC [Alphaproteobacteria bacterium]